MLKKKKHVSAKTQDVLSEWPTDGNFELMATKMSSYCGCSYASDLGWTKNNGRKVYLHIH